MHPCSTGMIVRLLVLVRKTRFTLGSFSGGNPCFLVVIHGIKKSTNPLTIIGKSVYYQSLRIVCIRIVDLEVAGSRPAGGTTPSLTLRPTSPDWPVARRRPYRLGCPYLMAMGFPRRATWRFRAPGIGRGTIHNGHSGSNGSTSFAFARPALQMSPTTVRPPQGVGDNFFSRITQM